MKTFLIAPSAVHGMPPFDVQADNHSAAARAGAQKIYRWTVSSVRRVTDPDQEGNAHWQAASADALVGATFHVKLVGE